MFRSLLVLIAFWAQQEIWANCTVPTLLTAISTTDYSANLTWTDVGDAYELELRQASETFTGGATHTAPSGPPFVATGLTPGENYKFRVRTLCTGGGTSAWSAARNFSTQLNNTRPCPLDFTLRDTTCSTTSQFFTLHVDNAPGSTLGTDVLLKGLRLVITHPWRSDLRVWLHSPDGTRVQVLGGLNAGDQNLGDPSGNSGCGQYLELSDDPSAPLLASAAEQDNITGLWRSLDPLSNLQLGQNPNGAWKLEICDSKLNHIGKLRLAQLVFEPVGCPTPPTPTVDNIGLNSATVTWDLTGSDADSLEVVYGPAGFLPEFAGIRTLLPATAGLPYLLNGLNALQGYEVYLRVRCAYSGVWSGYTAPASFFTVCPAVLQEDFESLSTCPTGCTDPCPLPGTWQNVPGDDYEWKVRSGTGITYPTAGPQTGAGGSGNYLFFRNSCSPSGANGKKALLRTRCLDIVAPAGPPCHFSMDLYMNTKLGQMGTLALQGSTNGGVTWQTLQTWSGNQGKQWKRIFVNLSAFDGQTALFQLVATGVFGAYGDIAIDNLTFYGATPAGSPDFTFYRDQDQDGFGNSADKIVTCTPDAPTGYVANASDCNDNDPQIHPNSAEIKCNGVDENCNGNADDTTIPMPAVIGPSSVCAGANAGLNINIGALGQYYWFDAPSGGQVLHIGNSLTLNNLDASTTFWIADSIANGGCTSNRTAFSIQVTPQPDLVLGQAAAVCRGTSLDLAQLPLNDLNNTTGTLTYHNLLGNPLANTTVQPNTNTTYFAQKITPNGCTDTVQIAVTVYSIPSVSIQNGDSLALCKGKSLTLVAQGSGTAPLQYQWSNGLFQKNIEVAALSNGTTTYTVTVTDQNGCTQKDAFRLTTLSGVSQTNVAQLQHVSICGGSDGRIQLQPLDGLPPYQFQWAGPNQTAGTVTNIGNNGGSITGLTQGGYRVTITDGTGNGCSMVLPPLVLNAPGLSVNTPEITQPLCAGSTGSIAVTAVGSAPTFQWSNSTTAATATGLTSGTYSVTVADGACTQVISGLNIVAPLPVLANINQTTAIDCAGNNNGSIDIAVSGGTGPYSYLWNDLSTSQDRSQLGPGLYGVTVTDAKGCTGTSPQWPIVAPAPLLATAQSQSATCFGQSDGAATLQISGGNGGYFIEWSTGDFTAQITDLSAGTYTATITDAKSCTTTHTAVVGQPAALTIALVQLQQPSCIGKADGSLSVTALGGTGNIGLQWNNQAQTTTLSALTAGSYRATATDANGCTTASDLYTLTAPDVIDLQVNALTPARCFGESSGTIDVSANSNYNDLVLYLDGVPASFPQSNLPAGDYLVRAVDGNGCMKDTLLELSQPAAPLSLTVAALQPVSCQGDPTGIIDVHTAGGTAPYQYLWSNGSTTEDLDAALAGSYYLDVTDAKGCQGGIADLVLPEPPAVSIDAQIHDIECIGAPLGKIILSVSGGSAPFQYQWSNGATTSALFDVPAGPYTVSIFDAAGCVTVFEQLEVVDKASVFGVNFSGYSPVSCNAGNDGWLQAQVQNGTPPYQYAWSAPVGLHTNIPTATDNALNLSGGLYSVTVTDAAGCYRSAGPFLVEEAPPLIAQAPVPAPIACKGDTTGTAWVVAVGGVPPIAYHWPNGYTNAMATGLSAGTYNVTLTDSRGCSSISEVVLEEPKTALTIETAAIEADFCSDSSGAIYTNVLGGHSGYTYAWSIANSTSSLVGIPAGQYTVTVTDGQGCTATETWTLDQQPPALALGSYSITPVACKGAATGRIEIGITGGHLLLNYFWSNGDVTANLSGLVAGDYRVTVQDQAGCLGIFEFPPVTEPALPLQATYSSISLAGGYTVVLNITGGDPGYTVNWDEASGYQTGPVATNLAGGYYTATITDAGGCTLVLNAYAGPSATHDHNANTIPAQIAPNPAQGTAIVRLNGLGKQGGYWRLIHINGTVAQTGTWDTQAQNFALDAASGVYYLELVGARAQVLKWIKL